MKSYTISRDSVHLEIPDDILAKISALTWHHNIKSQKSQCHFYRFNSKWPPLHCRHLSSGRKCQLMVIPSCFAHVQSKRHFRKTCTSIKQSEKKRPIRQVLNQFRSKDNAESSRNHLSTRQLFPYYGRLKKGVLLSELFLSSFLNQTLTLHKKSQ